MLRKSRNLYYKFYSTFIPFSPQTPYYTMKYQHQTNEYIQEHSIPLSPFQKAFLAIGSAATLIFNPLRTDLLATLTETMPFTECTLHRLHLKMLSNENGREILSKKPIVHESQFKNLHTLPKDTFGYQYYEYMSSNQFLASERSPVKYLETINPDYIYILRRYREVHDFIHVLTGVRDPHVLPELAVKWFEMMQFQLPMTIAVSLTSSFSWQLSHQERLFLTKEIIPWAIQCSQSEFILNIPFEQLLDVKVETLQQLYKIPAVPQLPLTV